MLRRFLYILMFAAGLLGLGHTAHAQAAGPWHPLDALTPQEIETAVSLLQQAGHADSATVFSAMTLAEADKQAVLAWTQGQPFTRKAFVVLRRDRKTFEANVDLTAKKVLSHREVIGAQTSITQEEWSLARQITLDDKGWQNAMRARGITDFTKVACTPLPAGPREAGSAQSARVLKVPCFSLEHRLHPAHGRPIEGLVAVVDVDAKELVRLIDDGAKVEIGPPPATYGAASWSPRDPMKPVRNMLPAGSNISIRGTYQVAWQNWSFHLRADRRAGAIVSLVRYNDNGRARLIAYQMHVSEMFVPYAVPDPTWAFRGYLDAGELGLGYLISSLRAGADCPAQSYVIDLLMPSDKGGMFVAPKALCIFERATGNPAWRHYDAGTQRIAARPEIELVVRIIPTIGNYDYVIDYIFQPRGTIKLRAGATGLDAIRSSDQAKVSPKQALAETPRDTLIAPYTVAPFHEHFISYRIDLDIDGPKNLAVRDTLGVATENGNRVVKRTIHAQPGEGPMAFQPDHAGNWRIANPNKTTALGYAPSYQIVHGHYQPPVDGQSPLFVRAGFARQPLWLTRQDPRETWAAGDYPVLSGGDTGLPAYVSDKDSVHNQDLVIWPTLSFRHVTRPEDFPVLPTLWHEIRLRPMHFFDRDPSHDLAPRFAKPAATE